MNKELKAYYSKTLLNRLTPALFTVNGSEICDQPFCGRPAWATDGIGNKWCDQCANKSAKQLPLANASYSALTFTISQYGAYTQDSDTFLQNGFDGLDDNLFEE